MLDGQRRAEHERRRLVADEVERFREAQQGADVVAGGEGEATEGEVWRKRRRGEKRRRSEVDVKRRKTDEGKKEHDADKKATQSKEVKNEDIKAEPETAKPAEKIVAVKAAAGPTKPNPVALGLDYGSDDSD